MADPTGKDAYLSAFRTLLHSGHTAAAGIALDHFQYSDALTRFGGESVVEQYAPEVLTVARGLLRQPPAPEDDSTTAGANHASALNAMMNIAEAADADLIRRRPGVRHRGECGLGRLLGGRHGAGRGCGREPATGRGAGRAVAGGGHAVGRPLGA
ncbi:hypothetical protein ACH4SK_06650 [Streptomyces inhibens]|uniref:hypothetical protein n=1 Tax=Streptomyces inhibens TaxID=2293571 RepID=UPI0037A75ACE